MRRYRDLPVSGRIFAATVITAGLISLPIEWFLQPVPLATLPQLVYLAVGTQIAALIPIRWSRGSWLIVPPLLVAAALFAPGVGVGIIAWLCTYDGRRVGKSIRFWALLFNRANLALTYGLPSIALAYFPQEAIWSLPARTLLLSLAVLIINLSLTSRVIAYMTNVSFVDALSQNVGFASLRSTLVLCFVGGVLYVVLKSPAGYLMAPAIFGLLLAVRANIQDVQRQAEARRQTLRLAAQALDARDRYTESHSERVADLAVQLGQMLELGGRDLEQLREAATLHDLGKIGVPDGILNKPDRLNEQEWEAMKRHPDIGADMLMRHSAFAAIADSVRHHHEKWSGGGYPRGLVGTTIPLGARILSVADSYDTITTPRIYRRTALKPLEAVEDISRHAGDWYDPRVVDALRLLHGLPRLHVEPEPVAEPFRPVGSLRLLRTHPRFALLLVAIGVSSFGDPLTTVATMVSIYAATKQPLAVAASYVVQAAATMLVSAMLGGLSDRAPRRYLIFWLEWIRGGVLLVTPLLLMISIWWIFPVVFGLSAVNALVQPSRQAAIPELVGEGEVGAANAMVTGLSMLAGAAGFPLAGLILWISGSSAWLFRIDAITFITAGIVIATLGALGGGVGTIRVTNALQRAWSVKPTRPHLLVMAIAVIFVSMSYPTLIALAYNLSDHGAQAYTLLQTFLALGIVIGSVVVGRMRNIGTMRTVSLGLLVMGLFSLGVAGSPWLLLTAVFLFAASVGNPIFAVGNQTALLELGNFSNRGSLMTTRFAIVQMALILGSWAGGVISGAFGPQATYAVIGTGLGLLSTAAVWVGGMPVTAKVQGRGPESATPSAANST